MRGGRGLGGEVGVDCDFKLRDGVGWFVGYQDRSYYRDRPSGSNPLMWLFSGSVPLFSIAGIRVRAHASLVVLCGLVLIFGLPTFTRQDSVIFVSMLFVIVLLHEFGHCIGARIMGGEAVDIMMSPLGGLAFTMGPRRPLARFVTVAAGPAVNVLLMLVAAIAMYAMGGRPPWWPYGFRVPREIVGWDNLFWYVLWFFQINYGLLLFNLLPIFPLDGGQLLQTILWKPLGYYKSMLVAVTIGIGGAILLALWGFSIGSALTVIVAINCLLTSVPLRAQLKAAGPWAFQEEETDYSAAQWRPEKVNPGAAKKAAKAAALAEQEAADERAEQAKIDKILAKVSAQGMHSLNFMEKRTLKTATEKQRQRELNRRK